MSTAESCPVSGDINIFETETLINPWDAYQTLRDEAPIAFMPAMGLHVVTRYDLLMEVIRDTKTYSSQFGAFMARARGAWLEMPLKTFARNIWPSTARPLCRRQHC